MIAKPTAQRIERSTTAAEVAKVLRLRILDGTYKEGEFLRQETIAQELGVSRLPVREALALLENEGFVLRKKYQGAMVPRLSADEIAEIYDLRLMIEPHLLKTALPAITAADIEEAHALIQLSLDCADMDQWSELNWALHKAFYAPANLPLTMQMLEQLLSRADRYLKIQQHLSRESQQASDKQHQTILSLIASGKGDDAVAALQHHIEWNAQDVIASFRRAMGG
jgi:DNA-binding GntR family transcriptional regulator